MSPINAARQCIDEQYELPSTGCQVDEAETAGP